LEKGGPQKGKKVSDKVSTIKGGESEAESIRDEGHRHTGEKKRGTELNSPGKDPPKGGELKWYGKGTYLSSGKG